MTSYVSCHGNNKMMPKFVNKNGKAKAAFAELRWTNVPTKMKPRQSTWITNLQCLKPVNPVEAFHIREVLENIEISDEKCLQALDKANDLNDGIKEMRDNM
jgi:hypothetical protein